MIRWLCILATAFGVFSTCAWAHEVRPGYLEIREVTPGTYDMLWKVPARGDERLAIDVAMPEGTQQVSDSRGIAVGGAYIERWQVRREGGLAGTNITIDGLNATGIDVLVRIAHADGSTQTTRVSAAQPSLFVQRAPTSLQVAGTYVLLGVEHILGGIDHLLFILALLLLVKGWKRLVGTVTAFTVAHSITLAAATLGWVRVPGPPVEACIALSIVFVAAEVMRRREGAAGLAERAPSLVAFAFGLLHGFGFAGALSEVGLPQTAIPMALLSFNVGVEIGQLAFIAAIAAIAALARVAWRAMPTPIPVWVRHVPPYAIGCVAMFWLIERVAAF